MEDEVFEKVFKDLGSKYLLLMRGFDMNLTPEEYEIKIKQEVRTILEEIENNAIVKCSEHHSVCFYTDKGGKSIFPKDDKEVSNE